MRGPDAAWTRRERTEALPASEVDSIPHLVPDFVVEVRSKSNRLRRLRAKMEEYLANGVRLGWLLDPTTKTVYVYRAGAEVQVIENATSLDGSPELPGFVLDWRRSGATADSASRPRALAARPSAPGVGITPSGEG